MRSEGKYTNGIVDKEHAKEKQHRRADHPQPSLVAISS
jgi:hypothetical protein